MSEQKPIEPVPSDIATAVAVLTTKVEALRAEVTRIEARLWQVALGAAAATAALQAAGPAAAASLKAGISALAGQ